MLFQYTSEVNIAESLYTGLYIIVSKTEDTSEEFYQEIVDYLNTNLSSFNVRNLVSKFINDEQIDWVKQRNCYSSKLRLGPTQILWNTDPECASPSDHVLNFSRSKFLLKLSTSIKHFSQPSKIQLRYIKERELEHLYIPNVFYDRNVIATIIAHEGENMDSQSLIKFFYQKKRQHSHLKKVKFQFLLSRSELDFAKKLSDEFDRHAVLEKMGKYNTWNEMSSDDDVIYDSLVFLDNKNLVFQSLNEIMLDLLTTFLSQLVKVLGDPNYLLEEVRKKTSQHSTSSKLKNIKYKGSDVKNYGDMYLVLNNYDMSLPYYLASNHYFSKERNYLGNARCMFSLCVCICKKFKFNHFLGLESIEDTVSSVDQKLERKGSVEKVEKKEKDKYDKSNKEDRRSNYEEDKMEKLEKEEKKNKEVEKLEDTDSSEGYDVNKTDSQSSLSSTSSTSESSSNEMNVETHHKDKVDKKKTSKSKQESIIPKEMVEKPLVHLLYYIKRSFLLWLKSFDNSDEFSVLFVFYVNILLKINSDFVNRVISSFIVYSNKMLNLNQQCNILKYIIEVMSETKFSRKVKFYRFLYDEKMTEKVLKDEEYYSSSSYAEEDNHSSSSKDVNEYRDNNREYGYRDSRREDRDYKSNIRVDNVEEENNKQKQHGREEEKDNRRSNGEGENTKREDRGYNDSEDDSKVYEHESIKSHDLSLYNMIVFLFYNLKSTEVEDVFKKCNEYYYWYQIKKAITENETVILQTVANHHDVQKMFLFTLFNIFNSLSEVQESVKLKSVLDEVNQASLDVPKLDTQFFTITHLVLSNKITTGLVRSGLKGNKVNDLLVNGVSSLFTELKQRTHEVYFTGGFENMHFNKFPICFSFNLIGHKFNFTYSKAKLKKVEHYYKPEPKDKEKTSSNTSNANSKEVNEYRDNTYEKQDDKDNINKENEKEKEDSGRLCMVMRKRYSYKSFMKCNYMSVYRRNLMMYLISINSNRTVDSNMSLDRGYINREEDDEDVKLKSKGKIENLKRENRMEVNQPRCLIVHEKVTRNLRCRIRKVERVKKVVKTKRRSLKLTKWDDTNNSNKDNENRNSKDNNRKEENVEDRENNEYSDNNSTSKVEDKNIGMTKFTQYIYDDSVEENVVYVDSVLNIEVLFSNPLPIGLYLKDVLLLGHGAKFECISKNILLQSFTKQNKESFNIIIKEPGRVYITGIKFILFDTFECYQVLMDSSKVEEVVGFLNNIESNFRKDSKSKEDVEDVEDRKEEKEKEDVDKRLVEEFNSCAQLDLHAVHDYNKSSLEVYFTDFSEATEITNLEMNNNISNLLDLKSVNRSLTSSTYRKLSRTFFNTLSSNPSTNRSNTSNTNINSSNSINSNRSNDNNTNSTEMLDEKFNKYNLSNNKSDTTSNNNNDNNSTNRSNKDEDNVFMRSNLGSYRSSLAGSNVESARSRYESWNGLRVPNFGQGTVSREVKRCEDVLCNWCRVFYHFQNKFTETTSLQKLVNGERKLFYVKLVNRNKSHAFVNIKFSVIPTNYTDDSKGSIHIITARDYVDEQAVKSKIENLKREIYSRYVVILNEQCIVMKDNTNNSNTTSSKEVKEYRDDTNGNSNSNTNDSNRRVDNVEDRKEEKEKEDEIVLRPGEWIYVPIVYRASEVLSSFNVIFDYEIVHVDMLENYQNQDLMKGNSTKYVNIEVENRLRISDFEFEKNVDFNDEYFISNLHNFRTIFKESTFKLFRKYTPIFDQMYIRAYLKVRNDTKETFSCNINKRNPFIVSSGSSTRWCVKLRRLKYQNLKNTDSWQFMKIITSNLELKWSCYPDRIGSIKLYDLNTSKLNPEALRRYVEGDFSMGFVGRRKRLSKYMLNKNTTSNNSNNTTSSNSSKEVNEYRDNNKNSNINNNNRDILRNEIRNRNSEINKNKNKKNQFNIYGDYSRSYVWKMNKLHRVPKWYWSNLQSLVYENFENLVMSKLSLQIAISLDDQDEGSTERQFRVEMGSKFKVNVLVKNRSDTTINDYRVIVLPYVNECYMAVYGLEWAGSLDQIGQKPILPSSKFKRQNNKFNRIQAELDSSEQEFEYFMDVAKVEFVCFHPCTMAVNVAIIVEGEKTIYWHHEPSIIYVD